jgi:hypothetical protein
MTLSSANIDRAWSREELERLPPRELTWLTWRRHYRNAVSSAQPRWPRITFRNWRDFSAR